MLGCCDPGWLGENCDASDSSTMLDLHSSLHRGKVEWNGPEMPWAAQPPWKAVWSHSGGDEEMLHFNKGGGRERAGDR